MYKILIIEDDKTITNELKKYIMSWNHSVEIIKDFQNILSKFTEFNPDLVLLDISLPFYNGYHWCEEIRKISTVPIIFISSSADKMNQIMAMTIGADDFISKPFDLELLMTKINALIRRAYDFTPEINILEHRSVFLNLNNNSVTYNDNKVDLSKNEFKILHLLMSNKDKIIDRENIMLKLWNTDSFIDDNTLTVNVSRLREKLSSIGVTDFIETKKGIGYIIRTF